MKLITFIGTTTMALAILSPLAYFNNPSLAFFLLVPQVLFNGFYLNYLSNKFVKEREGVEDA